MGELTEFIKAQAGQKKPPQSPAAWLAKTINGLPKVWLATHVGKFNHPNAKVSLYDSARTKADGYVITENSDVPVDFAYNNATDIPPAKLLMHQLEGGKSLYENLLERNAGPMHELQALGINPEVLVAKLSTLDHGMPTETYDGLRQVYFPVGNNDYHLLTALPAISLLMALKQKLRKMSQEGWQARKADSDSYGNEYDAVYGTVKIHFGGSKTQNVSSIHNNNEHGDFFLLPSLPPELSERSVRRPKWNFFRESVPFSAYGQYLYQLKKLLPLYQKHNNLDIREQISYTIDAVVDTVMYEASLLQDIPGWSEADTYKGLPMVQRYWLDPAYREQHEENAWEDEISRLFARWLVYRCNSVLKEDGIVLADVDFQYFAKRMRHVLKWESGDEDDLSVASST